VLGYHVHRQLAGQLKASNRGLKHFRYSVLRSVECPAVLVEAGFLSHDSEARKIATGTYRQQIAAAIAAGVKAYAETIARLKPARG
jgi:N-acetylmuramoyl-L-alanine amidase